MWLCFCFGWKASGTVYSYFQFCILVSFIEQLPFLIRKIIVYSHQNYKSCIPHLLLSPIYDRYHMVNLLRLDGWINNALQQHSFLENFEFEGHSNSIKRTKLKRTPALFEFQHMISLAGDDEEKVDTILFGLQKISTTI